ncbi:MAG: MmgE/PrpD family protein, partial [Xanthobacteraceae bacterium]
MLHRPGITQNLARFLVEIGWSDVPEDVRHQARRALMNFFAVALSGCRAGPVEIALRSLAEFSDRKQATVIGRGERMDALSAAFLNAASANVFDFDDTHVPTVIHPTAPVAPALFALAELRPVTGAELLTAFVLGVELECRIGRAVFPGHYAKGWHITTTCGVFGAAAGSGRLAGLDRERMVWALGNAATQSSGLCECLGWAAKSVGVGNAARNGLWSALLAEQGFEGPPEPIAGVQGFLNAMAEPPNWPALTDGWGETWELAHNSIKPYPCGFVIHPFLDCVLDWRRAHPGAPVERVMLRGNPLLSDRTDRPDVATGRESQVSVQHAVAAALVFAEAGLAQFTDECARDPAVVAMRRRIAVVRDPAVATVAAEI